MIRSLLAVILLFTSSLQSTFAMPLDRLVVIGDSLSDTGNLTTISGGAIPPSPPYAPGRFSNGDLWTDVAASALGLAVNEALTSGPMGSGFVDNFSVSGSFTGSYALGPGVSVSNVADLLAVLTGGTLAGVPGVSQQFGAYAFSGIDVTATHFTWAGANDLLYSAVLNPVAPVDVAVLEAFADNVAANVFEILVGLHAAGVTESVVVNLPDLGTTPFADGVTPFDPTIGALFLSLFGGDASALSAYLSLASQFFNEELQNLLLARALPVRLFDVDGLVPTVLSNPAAFGFANVESPCLIDAFSLTSCPNPDEYLYWDDVHPTAAAHAILAGQLLPTIRGVPTPGTFLLLCLGGILIVWRARRSNTIWPKRYRRYALD